VFFGFRFDWSHPYAWRTNLRIVLPSPFGWWLPKGKDCEERGAEHHWYNKDDENSACYHCNVIRPGQLWKNR
jgi:hypothetical protein